MSWTRLRIGAFRSGRCANATACGRSTSRGERGSRRARSRGSSCGQAEGQLAASKLERVVGAVGGSLDVRVRWNGESLDRLLDATHAATVDATLRLLARHRWAAAAPRCTFSDPRRTWLDRRPRLATSIGTAAGGRSQVRDTGHPIDAHVTRPQGAARSHGSLVAWIRKCRRRVPAARRLTRARRAVDASKRIRRSWRPRFLSGVARSRSGCGTLEPVRPPLPPRLLSLYPHDGC